MPDNIAKSKDINQSGISAPSITLPKGGGAIKGIGETYRVNQFSGTGSFSIPVFVTPARGFEPEIRLDYNSGAGNGVYGLGFSHPIPNISRKTEKRIPRYDDSDTFILSNAEELVVKLTKDSDGRWIRNEKKVTDEVATWIVTGYRPRTEESFAGIEFWSSPESSYWKVISRDNITTIYGMNENARVSDPWNKTRVFQWLAEKSWDARGNEILYTYKQENSEGIAYPILLQGRASCANKYIQSIKYGNYQYADAKGNMNKQYAFEIVFDYGEYDLEGANPYVPMKDWDVREDPFTSYRPGFEMRTQRLCKSILLFHHLSGENEDNPFLVRAMKFKYSAGRMVSMLESVEETGFRRNGKGACEAKSLPPIKFAYSSFNPEDQVYKPLTVKNGSAMPDFLKKTGYIPVDLYGDGLPGLLFSNRTTTLYLRPKGGGVYEPPAAPCQMPIEKNLGDKQYTLEDLDGSGQLDLVVSAPPRGGYYGSRADGTWEPYLSFESYPPDMSNPDRNMVDLDGNGLAEILIFEDNFIKYYASLGKKGYGPPVRVQKEKNMPDGGNDYEEEVLRFVDMFGDGLAHRVRIRNGRVECWPNLGYGRFGEKIIFGNAPRFGDRMEASRVFLADIDGSGTTDIIYVYHDRLCVFFNQSGNCFSDPVSIPLFRHYDSFSQISFADVLGNGTSCLVFTTGEPDMKHYYFDFSGGIKPYLLNRIENSTGAVTRIEYTSSTKFHLDGLASGKPWKTRLHFPVQVVEKVVHTDLVSGIEMVECLKYHDGFYDGIEREFRGFGFVEHWDVEMCKDKSELNSAIKIPPVYTKSWYHTGAYLEQDAMSNQYLKDYWQGDSKGHRLPDSLFESVQGQADYETMQQARRALKGRLLRKEVYGLDGHDNSGHPYTVDETNFKVREIQPSVDHRYAAFSVQTCETLSCNYERNPADPRIHHGFIIVVDDYGNVLESCEVFYPRRLPERECRSANPADQIYEEQKKLKATIKQAYFANKIELAGSGVEKSRLLGLICEHKEFEAVNLTPGTCNYFSFNDIKEQVEQAIKNQIRYDEEFSAVHKQARLISWERYYYWNDTLEKAVSGHDISGLALLHHTRQAVFTPELVERVFGDKLSPDILQNDGLYIVRDGYWWNVGLTQFYYRDGFYLPWKTEGPDGGITSLKYDGYWLSPVVSTRYLSDKIKSSTHSLIDYYTMKPRQTTDANGNVAQVMFDPLGMVVATSVYGTTGEKPEGDDDLAKYERQQDETFSNVLSYPAKYLRNATTYFFYDFSGWPESGQPLCTINLVRDTHINNPDGLDETGIQVIIKYFDGFGREIETKLKTDPDGDGQERWSAAGRTAYNNKGKPFQQYLSYFSAEPIYQSREDVIKLCPPPAVIYYDPLLREIRKDTPKGFLTKVEFTPWVEKHYDENDTVIDSAFYREHINDQSPEFADEREALVKAAAFYNTPEQKILDNMGNAFITVQTNIMAASETQGDASYLLTRSALDIRGNLLRITDPRLSVPNLVQVFDMSGGVLSSTSVDSGSTLNLINIYGHTVHTWNGRGFHIKTSYDAYQRPVEVFVEGRDDHGLTLSQVVEQIKYGELMPEAAKNNLNGQVVQHHDQAGVLYFDLYDIGGKAVKSRRQFRQDYDCEANWSNLALETEIFNSGFSCNALGQKTSQFTPDGSVQMFQYNVAGLIKGISAKFSDETAHCFVEDVQYNANNQRTTVFSGNGVKVVYDYEPTTLRLFKIKATRSEKDSSGQQRNKTIQDIKYTYDPVGNITRIYDSSYQTVFNNQQVVNPLFQYSYDTLYRLTRAKGRQHPALQARQSTGFNRHRIKAPVFSVPGLNDGQGLENYTQNYTYDNSGNLVEISHTAASASWTVKNDLDPASNRTLPKETYDQNGNLISLDNLRDIKWNYRNKISSAAVVIRNEGKSDLEYYVYDTDGNRVRKVTERVNGSGTRVEEKIYLDGLEIKRVRVVTAGGTSVKLERQSLSVRDSKKRLAVSHYWIKDDLHSESDIIGRRSFHYQYDNNVGSACVEADEQANIISYEEYYPYGGTSIMAGDDLREVNLKTYRYSGKELDDFTGLYYYGARYYAPWMGRWLSPDPAGMVDGLNLYAFVGGNPVKKLDINGMVGGLQTYQEGISFHNIVRLWNDRIIDPGSTPKAMPHALIPAPTDTNWSSQRLGSHMLFEGDKLGGTSFGTQKLTWGDNYQNQHVIPKNSLSGNAVTLMSKISFDFDNAYNGLFCPVPKFIGSNPHFYAFNPQYSNVIMSTPVTLQYAQQQNMMNPLFTTASPHTGGHMPYTTGVMSMLLGDIYSRATQPHNTWNVEKMEYEVFKTLTLVRHASNLGVPIYTQNNYHVGNQKYIFAGSAIGHLISDINEIPNKEGEAATKQLGKVWSTALTSLRSQFQTTYGHSW